MQHAIHSESKDAFDSRLAEQLREGATVVPGTFSVQFHEILGWNPRTNEHDKPMRVVSYFVVVEK